MVTVSKLYLLVPLLDCSITCSLPPGRAIFNCSFDIWIHFSYRSSKPGRVQTPSFKLLRLFLCCDHHHSAGGTSQRKLSQGV